MGDGRRVQRFEKELQQVVAKFLITDFQSELPGLVTISKVIMTGDLRTAKVYISILGSAEDKKMVITNLKNRMSDVQRYLGSELKSRYTPKITFYEDETTEKVLKIESILRDLEEQRKLDEEKNKEK